MKKLKKPTYKIFSFDDITLEMIYQNHLDLIRKGELSDNNPAWLNLSIGEYNQNNRKISKIIPRKFEMLEKYQFMIHLLITKTFNTGHVDLPASYLRYMFGDYYSIMLHNLCSMGYFHRNEYYEKGEQVRRIHISKNNIICRQKYDKGFEKYWNKYLKKKKQLSDDKLKRMYRNFGKLFIDQNIHNLNQLKLNDESGARDYIQKNISDDYSKEKNLYVIDQYCNGDISLYNIDKNNRIYSLLTNTNKNLRSYLNIKYILDISNCHPLLFNKYIIDKYYISDFIISILYNINTNILFNEKKYIYTQYVSNVFSKLLLDNNIQVSELNGISIDELLYITLTSQGRFWDFIMLDDRFDGVDKSEVKDKMFQEVFYSKTLGGNNMIYQEGFKNVFPNVFKMILDFRKKHRKGEKHLSHSMMQLESEIIHNTLRKLFELGYCVLNIHDAIVVLDVEQNIHLDLDEIIRIIQQELKNIGLYGKVKVEEI